MGDLQDIAAVILSDKLPVHRGASGSTIIATVGIPNGLVKSIDATIPETVDRTTLQNKLIIRVVAARGWLGFGFGFGFGFKHRHHSLCLSLVTCCIHSRVGQCVGACGTSNSARNNHVQCSVHTVIGNSARLSVSRIALKGHRTTAVQRHSGRCRVRDSHNALYRAFVARSIGC